MIKDVDNVGINLNMHILVKGLHLNNAFCKCYDASAIALPHNDWQHLFILSRQVELFSLLMYNY